MHVIASIQAPSSMLGSSTEGDPYLRFYLLPGINKENHQFEFEFEFELHVVLSRSSILSDTLFLPFYKFQKA